MTKTDRYEFWVEEASDRPDIFGPPTIAPQGLDGTPHFNYYDRERMLSFQWDGRLGQHVTVSHGGYGEPVRWTFDFMEHWRIGLSPLLGSDHQPQFRDEMFWTAASHFQRACDNWIAKQEGA